MLVHQKRPPLLSDRRCSVETNSSLKRMASSKACSRISLRSTGCKPSAALDASSSKKAASSFRSQVFGGNELILEADGFVEGMLQDLIEIDRLQTLSGPGC